jgi:hypothetical protein
MTDRIEPVMTADDWAHALKVGLREYDSAVADTPWHCAYVIALNNAALPSTDPRKITRERIEHIRDMLGADSSWTGASDEDFARAQHILDALASYLPPPEGT